MQPGAGFGPRLCSADVLDVVGHDGRNDAAECRAYATAIRAHQPGRARRRTLLRADRHFRCGLSRCLGWIQRACDGAQWGLQQIDLLSPMMATSSPLLAAAILIGAGAWQLTPIKRMPAALPFTSGLFRTSWRRGRSARSAWVWNTAPTASVAAGF